MQQHETWKTDEKGTRRLASYDAFKAWKDEMKRHFETCEYVDGAMPLLPDSWQKGYEIYCAAPADEQCLIAGSLLTFFLEGMRHWRTDLEKLYGKEQEAHAALMAQMASLQGFAANVRIESPVKFPGGI